MAQLFASLWQGWKYIAHRIGEFQSRVLLTVLYLVFFAPLTLIVRAKDPLGLRGFPRWRPYQSNAADLRSAKRQ